MNKRLRISPFPPLQARKSQVVSNKHVNYLDFDQEKVVIPVNFSNKFSLKSLEQSKEKIEAQKRQSSLQSKEERALISQGKSVTDLIQSRASP